MHTSGSLDARGSWTSSTAIRPSRDTGLAKISPDSSPRTVGLKLAKVGGEWRITNPPDGAFINTDYFIRYYQDFSLYFFDPSRSILAPDPVYLLVGDTSATDLVEGLLQGPTRDLRTAVTTAVPAGTALQISVSLSRSGLAEVPLSNDVLNLNATERQLFAAQLAWTLRQVEGITRVAITVDGRTLPIENTGSPFDVQGFAAYDPAGLAGERRLFALGPDGLVTVSASGVIPVQGPIGGVVGGSSVAVQTSGQLAAIVSKDGRLVQVGPIAQGSAVESGGVATWLKSKVPLLRPSWDARHVLWLVDRRASPSSAGAPRPCAVEPGSAQRISVMTDAKHGPYQVDAPWLAGRTIDSFNVSRDGVRFAAIVTEPDCERRLVVSTIVRGPGSPQSDHVTLLAPEIIHNEAAPLVRLRDLAWVSPTSLAVLGAERGSAIQTYEVAIDGSDIEAAGGFLPPGTVPTSIAAGPNADAPIAIATTEGNIDVQAPDLQWSGITGPLYAPAYPG
jgi:hypothetical protein